LDKVRAVSVSELKGVDIAAYQPQTTLCVAGNRRQRLVDFMSYVRGHFANYVEFGGLLQVLRVLAIYDLARVSFVDLILQWRVDERRLTVALWKRIGLMSDARHADANHRQFGWESGREQEAFQPCLNRIRV
jgi:hypothetical protein